MGRKGVTVKKSKTKPLGHFLALAVLTLGVAETPSLAET
jgi:hypothetical protein